MNQQTPDGEVTRWLQLPNGTLLHVSQEGSAGLLIGAVWELEGGGAEAALSQHGSPFWPEGTFSSIEDAIDKIDTQVAWFNGDAEHESVRERPPFSYDFNSDEDGDLWMHSDDPVSADCTVTVVRHRPDGTEDRTSSVGGGSGMMFPGLNYYAPLSAWCTGRDYCRLEIEDPNGKVTVIGSCNH